MQCPFCNEVVSDGTRTCKQCGFVIKWSMKKWQAFALAIVLHLVLVVLSMVGSVVGLAAMVLPACFVVLTAAWASFDARKIGAGSYASGFFTATPGNVLLGSLLLWIVVFPWYLYYRSHLLAGTVPVATEGPVDANCDMAAERDSLNR